MFTLAALSVDEDSQLVVLDPSEGAKGGDKSAKVDIMAGGDGTVVISDGSVEANSDCCCCSSCCWGAIFVLLLLLSGVATVSTNDDEAAEGPDSCEICAGDDSCSFLLSTTRGCCCFCSYDW